MIEISKVLFSYNGQYYTFEKFVLQVESMIGSAKTYEQNTATPINDRAKKQLIKALIEHLREKSE